MVHVGLLAGGHTAVDLAEHTAVQHLEQHLQGGNGGQIGAIKCIIVLNMN